MNFSASREEWTTELRNKSPIYAAYDENKNFCDVRRKAEDHDTDNDSGLQSIDGDSPQDRLFKACLLEEDLAILARQDSGVSSENSEIASPYLQLYSTNLATNNKVLSSKDLQEQVILNNVPAKDLNGRMKAGSNSHDRICQQNRHKEQNNISYFTKGVREEGKSPTLLENDHGILTRKKELRPDYVLGSNLKKIHGNVHLENGLSSKPTDSLNKVSVNDNSRISSFKCRKETTRDPSNASRVENYEFKDGRSFRQNAAPSFAQNQREPQKSHNLLLRNDLWASYKEVSDKLSDTIDQLLYKDLMCAYLTDEILNFSANHSTIEDELLEVEEKSVQDEIFNSASLLQTLTMISEHQHVEGKLLSKEMQKVDLEIRQRRLRLHVLERNFRNSKFKYAPKQLKRYCSVESLLDNFEDPEERNDSFLNQKFKCDRKEKFEEETSLV